MVDFRCFWLRRDRFALHVFLLVVITASPPNLIHDYHNLELPTGAPQGFLFGPIHVLFSACSVSDRQQSIQLFAAHSVITKPYLINRSSVHRHTPCLDCATVLNTAVYLQKFSPGSFLRSFEKVIFNHCCKKKINILSDHFHCSYQCPLSSKEMLRAVLLPVNCNLSVRHRAPEPSKLKILYEPGEKIKSRSTGAKQVERETDWCLSKRGDSKWLPDCYEIKNTISNGAKIARHTFVVIIRVLMRASTNTNTFNNSVKLKQRFSYWGTLFITVIIGMSILNINIALVNVIYKKYIYLKL